MIFGSHHDWVLLQHIGRELIADVIEQEVLYYKMNIAEMEANIYGESEYKTYYAPCRLTCLIDRGDKEWSETDYGQDLNRTMTFSFFKDDMIEVKVLPEVGDIVKWDGSYFEVDSINENRLFAGKNQDYRIDGNTGKFGSSISYILTTHLTRVDKLNIEEP